MILFFTFDNQRDHDVFDIMFALYKNLMFHKANEILRNRQLAEEAVSEAFLRIYKNLHKIEDPHSHQAAAFAVTVVKNMALTIWKKERRHDHADLEDAAQETDTGPVSSLEEQVLFQMSKDAIFQAVDRLGEELKNIFLLKYAYDLPHKEIARQLGVTENNVTVKLHRARKKLVDLLGEEGSVYEVR